MAGRAAFEDTVHAVSDLARGLRDGWGFWSRQRRRSLARNIAHGAGAARTLIRRLPNPLVMPAIGLAGRVLASVVSPRPIERVAFVATKADHVPALARDNLQHLLHAMADPAARDWQAANTQVSFHVAASILSTEDGIAKLDGQTVQVVRGTVLGEATVRPFYVGAVPSGFRRRASGRTAISRCRCSGRQRSTLPARTAFPIWDSTTYWSR